MDIEYKSRMLFDAVNKKDMTLADYDELYNKRADLEAEEQKESQRQEEIHYRDVISGILNSICCFMVKRETIMKYYLPDNVSALQIIEIFQRHGYTLRETTEHDKKTLVFYLDEPKKRLRSMEQER